MRSKCRGWRLVGLGSTPYNSSISCVWHVESVILFVLCTLARTDTQPSACGEHSHATASCVLPYVSVHSLLLQVLCMVCRTDLGSSRENPPARPEKAILGPKWPSGHPRTYHCVAQSHSPSLPREKWHLSRVRKICPPARPRGVVEGGAALRRLCLAPSSARGAEAMTNAVQPVAKRACFIRASAGV